MADSNYLRVMYILEAGPRLHISSEVVGLATHLYHKFFREQDISQFDLYVFGSACINLARRFYELPIDCHDIAFIMTSIVHGLEVKLEKKQLDNLARTIDYASQIVAINLNYQIDYKDTRRMTPGDLSKPPQKNNTDDDYNSQDKESSDDDSYDRDEAVFLLTRNSKQLISSHRYLAHYLKSIKLLVHPESLKYFKKLCNIAWIILSDFHWSLKVTQHYSHHLACASLMMAIEAYSKELNSTMSAKAMLWELVNKKWNLIFCDDFSNRRLEITITTIMQQYSEYERLLQHEISTYVIDPHNSNIDIL